MGRNRIEARCLAVFVVAVLLLGAGAIRSQDAKEKKSGGIIELLKLKKAEKSDDKKADEKKKPKADDKKADEKKADEKKADDKKADEKKADEKKADEKKADDKKSDEKKADDKKKPTAGDLEKLKALLGGGGNKLKLRAGVGRKGVKETVELIIGNPPIELASEEPEETEETEEPEEPEETDKPKPRRDPLPPMFHMRDGTRLAGYPGTTRIRVATVYGPLLVPISEVVRVRFAAALDENVSKQISNLVEQLGHEEFDLREEASEKLVNFGVAALPALRKATESDDEEIKSRAEKLATQLEEQIEEPDEDEVHLAPLEGDEDEVETLQFTVKGRVQEKSFGVKTRYGKLDFRREDILSIVFQEPLISKLTFDVAGNTFAAKNQWLDTETDLTKGETFELTASGTITIVNYGNIQCGPEGTTNVGTNMKNMAAGSLVAKIGDGKPFLVGSSYEGAVEKTGRLFLGVALNNGTIKGQFEVVLEKKEE